MIQITPLSDKQKKKIFKTMSRKKIIEMLLENQRIIESLPPTIKMIPQDSGYDLQKN